MRKKIELSLWGLLSTSLQSKPESNSTLRNSIKLIRMLLQNCSKLPHYSTRYPSPHPGIPLQSHRRRRSSRLHPPRQGRQPQIPQSSSQRNMRTGSQVVRRHFKRARSQEGPPASHRISGPHERSKRRLRPSLHRKLHQNNHVPAGWKHPINSQIRRQHGKLTEKFIRETKKEISWARTKWKEIQKSNYSQTSLHGGIWKIGAIVGTTSINLRQ